MIFYYAAFSIIITLIPANSAQNVMKSIEKQTTRLIRSIVPKSHFTPQDLKVDERQKILLRNARPLNAGKSIYELKGDLREESFDRKQFALVTKAKPSFIEDIPSLHFLNSFFDERVKINSPLHYPFTSICYLEATKPLSDRIIYWRGSGFLIGPNVLLTAKHCVESTFGKGEDPSFNALFGKTGDRELFDTKALEIHKHPKRDIAMVLLDQDVGLEVGSFKLSKEFKEKQIISVIGYPGVKTLMSYFRNRGETEMYGMTGPLLTVSKGKLTYSLDTSPGQSGGPVSDALTEKLSEYSAYGVHTNGGTSYNRGEAYDDDFEEFVLSGESKFLDFLKNEIPGKHKLQ